MLVKKLAEYLELETGIDWKYYSDIHNSTMEPKGACLRAKTTPVSDQRYLDYLQKSYRFKLRLLISDRNSWEVIAALEEWQDKLTDSIMRKLHSLGYEGLFYQIKFVEATNGIRENQDNGATGSVELLYDWSDDSVVAGTFEEWAS
jgi:hypothetical protein